MIRKNCEKAAFCFESDKTLLAVNEISETQRAMFDGDENT